jgi:acyl-CoA thioesterase FadM
VALDAPDGEAWAGLRASLEASKAGWTEMPFDPVTLPEKSGPVATGLARVKTNEAGDDGRLSLFGFVNRFSTANLVNMNVAGMTGTYMREQNRGFATFETRLELFGPAPALGEAVSTNSGMLDVGRSSVKILHEMRLQRGRRVARYYQAGVNFDLTARKSAPLSEDLRASASRFRITAD